MAQQREPKENPLQVLRLNLSKLWKKRSVTITDYDPTYRVVYLGNVVTGWAKGEGCVDRPVSTLWRNYCQSSKPDVGMKLTVTSSGLKAVTREHGLTEYWSHRITTCSAPPSHPRVFCWVYRHEGRKLKQEMRCHAVLCSKASKARAMASALQERLALALHEFKREKICRQNARLSLANSVYDNPSLPRRKILLSTGVQNYRPPIERSKSAPKLMMIEESLEVDVEELREEEEEEDTSNSIISESVSDVVVDYDSSSDGVTEEKGASGQQPSQRYVLQWDSAEEDQLSSSSGSSSKNSDGDSPLLSSHLVPDLTNALLLVDNYHSSPRLLIRTKPSNDVVSCSDESDDDSLSEEEMERTVVEMNVRDGPDEQDTLSDESGYSEEKLSLTKENENPSST